MCADDVVVIFVCDGGVVSILNVDLNALSGDSSVQSANISCSPSSRFVCVVFSYLNNPCSLPIYSSCAVCSSLNVTLHIVSGTVYNPSTSIMVVFMYLFCSGFIMNSSSPSKKSTDTSCCTVVVSPTRFVHVISNSKVCGEGNALNSNVSFTCIE